MTKRSLMLRCESVRVPLKSWAGLKSKQAKENKVREFLNKHHIANSLLVICGHYPISGCRPVFESSNENLSRPERNKRERDKNRYLRTKVWRPVNNFIYEALMGKENEFKFEFDHLELETQRQFISKQTPAKKGTFDKNLLKRNCDRKQGAKINLELVDEFENWLEERYSEKTGKIFHLLMKEYYEEFKDFSDKELKEVLPEKFHKLPVVKVNRTSFSKVITSPYVVRADGSMLGKGQGLMVLTGGPRKVLHANFNLTIELPADICSRILVDRVGGPGFATIGDGGMCWFLDEEK